MAHPNSLFIVTRGFNHSSLTSVLPKFHQHINFGTCADNILDLVYTNNSGAYKAVHLPHLGCLDHISILLTHISSLQTSPASCQVSSEGGENLASRCHLHPTHDFESTDCTVFKEAATDGGSVDLEEYAPQSLVISVGVLMMLSPPRPSSPGLTRSPGSQQRCETW
ncbi:hypothetical protein LDENG_00236930 [Lucifuga dentata]|nr:hypothetical protein LDENG_00236930 [Lucifuga dentata]